MRLVLGPFRDSREDTRDVSWRPVRESELDLMELFGVQLSLAVASVVLVLWLLAVPGVEFALDESTLVLGCVVLAPLHELVHASAFPHRTKAGDAILAFRPSRLILQAHYTGNLSRGRYVAMQAMPLLVLSLAPIVAGAILCIAPSEVILISLLNALVSGGDVMAVILVLAQVPAGASVRMVRDHTMWRSAPASDTLRLGPT